LEVELRFTGAKKSVIRNERYVDVIEMDGGKDAVAEVGPISAFMSPPTNQKWYCH
jgi:hypothetical protein